MRFPNFSGLISTISRLPLGVLAVLAIAVAIFVGYSRYQEKPIPSPERSSAQLPGVRPRDPGQYIRVLSIDGGGMRGLIPLHCLAYLEKRSGKPVSEMFDVIVGTSSGAFVAAALTTPLGKDTPRFSAAELIREYPKLWGRTMNYPVIHPLLSLEGRTAPKYLAVERQRVFQEFFGDSQLGDALTTVILPAFSLEEKAPFLFASDMGKSTTFSGTTGRAITEAGDFYLADAVTAATCNPAVSAPSRVTNSTRDQTQTLVGGEFYANSPVLLAVSEALLRFPGKQCVVISLGCGVAPSGAGLTGWKQSGSPEEIVRFAADASQFANAQIASAVHRFGSGPVAAYIRIDPQLPPNIPPADDPSVENVKAITTAAEKVITEKTATLDRTADFLGARP